MSRKLGAYQEVLVNAGQMIGDCNCCWNGGHSGVMRMNCLILIDGVVSAVPYAKENMKHLLCVCIAVAGTHASVCSGTVCELLYLYAGQHWQTAVGSTDELSV